MHTSPFSILLGEWEARKDQDAQKTRQTVSLFVSDTIKIKALAEVYQMPEEDILASVIHCGLLELESKIPYVKGTRVIRVEEGEEIFDDAGTMPRLLEAQQRISQRARKPS